MITVYVWRSRTGDKGKKEAYGHAALKVTRGSPPGEVYISWWPQDNGEDWCSNAHVNRTPEDDVRDEGQEADATINLEGLDETAVKSFWVDWQRDPQWCKAGRNCSTTVADALKAGGADDAILPLLGDGLPGMQYWRAHNTIWTPENVEAYANDIRQGLATRKLVGKAISALVQPTRWPGFYF